LVSSQKSSTFAAVFAPTAREQKNRAKIIEKCNAENQPLAKKMKKYCKKVAKKFGQSKKKQYLCSRFRAKREMSAKSQ